MIERLDVHSVEPYGFDGYEWVRGTAHFRADPEHPANRVIADLDLVADPTFDADVRLLRPTGDGNGKLLFVVANRGGLGGVPFSHGAPLQWATDDLDPGDGFLLEQGWTIAWCGWQWDVLPGPGAVGLRAPEADVEPGWMRIEWRPDAEHPDHALSDSSFLFTFADNPTAGDEGVLTERDSMDGERREIPRDRWRFVDGVKVELDDGFQPFRWYELLYRPTRAPVVGTGLLAVRDLVADLRQDFDHALAWGVSQSGRFLRQLLWDGLDVDEDGRPVFDGVFSHIAGGRRGEFNFRYAQPSLTHVIGPGYAGPYDNASLLDRSGSRPKTFFTNTAWEYWRGDGALLHVDPATGADLPEDPDVRTYLLSGCDHLGNFPLKDSIPVANPVHHLDTSLVLRALFVALDRWACDGVEPPPSQVPRQSDGTAARREDVLARFPDAARPEVLPVTRTIDWDGTWPLRLGEPVAAVVSDVDDDGNEVAGIRLPDVAAGTAAYTGWNPRRPVPGLPDVLYEFCGSELARPAKPDADERRRRAAEALVAGGFLLEADLEKTLVSGA